MLSSLKSASAAISAGLLAVSVASVAQADMAKVEVGGFYVGLGAAGVLPADIGISSGTEDDVVFSGSGDIEYDPGFGVTGALGYHFNEYIAVEAEAGYSQFDISGFNYSGTISSGGTTIQGSAATTVDGTVSTLSGLANVIISPLGDAAFRPYLGAGVGYIAYNEEIDRIGTLNTSIDETEQALLAAGLVGVDYRFNDHFSVGGQYRYFWAETGTNVTDNMTVHGLFLKMDFAF